MLYRWLGVALTGMLLSGCAHYISEDSLRLVNQAVPFSALKENPGKYIDSYLLVGGKIAKVTNNKEGGEIEVVQIPLDSNGRPLGDFRNSEGRFLAQIGGFVDPAIYEEGLIVSMVGQVKREKVQPLDAASYTYPLLAIRELHLWQPSELYPAYQSYPPYTYYSFPYDPPYRYGFCDFGYGPFPYYDWWDRDRCFLFDQHYAFPPVLLGPERHRHRSPPPAATSPQKNLNVAPHPEGGPPGGRPEGGKRDKDNDRHR